VALDSSGEQSREQQSSNDQIKGAGVGDRYPPGPLEG
jgi:hypothetical protein